MAKSGYCSVVLNSQSVANNTSTFTVAGIITTSGESYRGSHRSGTYYIYRGGVLIDSGTFTSGAPANSTTTLFSKTLTVTHNADGTSGAVTASYNYDSGWCSGSGSLTLPTIPRATIPALSDSEVNLGDTITISLPRASSSFTHTLQYDFLVGSWTTFATGAATSASLTAPLDWASRMPKAVRGSGRIRCLTYNGSTLIGEKIVVFYASVPASVVPAVSLALSDTEDLRTKYGKYIQGYSRLKIAVTASGVYGSTITGYKTTAQGSTYTEAEITIDNIKEGGTLTVQTTVTDSRGRTTSVSESIEVYAYDAPKITALGAKRCNENGESSSSGKYLKCSFDAELTSLDEQNVTHFVVKYKKVGKTEYTSVEITDYANVYSVEGGSYIFAADTNSSYDIILVITDSFTEKQKSASGPSTAKLWSRFLRGLGLAFGKVAELEGVLDIGFKTRHYGGILHMILEDGTDLNEVLTPNTYAGRDVSEAGYLNCPVTEGRFTLEVISAGDNGELLQRLTVCDKTQPLTYERFYYDEAWGDWICNFSTLSSKLELLSSPVMKAGTKVLEVLANDDSAVLFTSAQIADLFGHTFAGATKYVCVVTNGDGAANVSHIEGTTFSNEKLYVVLRDKQTSASNLRVNYVIFYMP